MTSSRGTSLLNITTEGSEHWARLGKAGGDFFCNHTFCFFILSIPLAPSDWDQDPRSKARSPRSPRWCTYFVHSNPHFVFFFFCVCCVCCVCVLCVNSILDSLLLLFSPRPPPHPENQGEKKKRRGTEEKKERGESVSRRATRRQERKETQNTNTNTNTRNMVRISVLNDCLRSMVNAERKGKRQVRQHNTTQHNTNETRPSGWMDVGGRARHAERGTQEGTQDQDTTSEEGGDPWSLCVEIRSPCRGPPDRRERHNRTHSVVVGSLVSRPPVFSRAPREGWERESSCSTTK